MNCKKIFIASALMSVISFLPNTSFSDAMQDSSTNGSFYISGKYVPTLSHFDNFSAKEDLVETKATFGVKKDFTGTTPTKDDFTVQKYAFKFANNLFLGFSGALGYSMDNLRIELEGAYETFDVKNPDNSYSNGAESYYALSRETGTTIQEKKFVYIKSDGIHNISLMLNACYDVTSDSIPFSPYVCAGLGTDFVSMFKATNTKLSYQGKLGISYSISPSTSIFVGGHFHKVVGNEFKDITPVVPTETEDTTSTHVLVTLHMYHFGLEVGGRFTF